VKVLVTGAAGFLGRVVVQAAVDAGHDVVAMVRPRSAAADLDWDRGQVTVVEGDLRQRGSWCDRLPPVDAVVHLAAGVSGDFAEQFRASVVGTEHLLGCLPLDQMQRFVHVSSLSVYEFDAIPDGAVLDETAPLEPALTARDAYTATKALQEQLITDTCRSAGLDLVVLRPGAILGPGKHWGWGAAAAAGPVSCLVAPLTRPPLTFVSNCADAIVRALDAPGAAGQVVNVIDDSLPTRLGLFWMARRAKATSAWPIPVPLAIVRVLAWGIDLVDRRWLGGRARVPELVSRRRQHARWKPLRYSNDAARQVLGWTPVVSIDDAVSLIAASEGAP
jgi:2-alkyl-3-oxoalkanoate reductase